MNSTLRNTTKSCLTWETGMDNWPQWACASHASMRMWVWIPRFHTKADKTQPCASVMPMARWRQRQESVWKAHGPTSPAYVVTHKTASNKMEDEDWHLRLSSDIYVFVMASDCPPTPHAHIYHTHIHIHTQMPFKNKYTLFAIKRELFEFLILENAMTFSLNKCNP